MRVSFEFFPPKEREAQRRLVDNVAAKLKEASPDFFSVTYGAGGSTRDGTLETVTYLNERGEHAAPHLSIGADDEPTVLKLLERYQSLGIDRVVALRGDLPSGEGRARFAANAETLVTLIRRHFDDAFLIEVAAYPEVHPDAKSQSEDLDFFVRKVQAGADSAITQYFYNPYAYLDFRDRCVRAGVDIPIHAGIMPILNFHSIMRFSNGCGADVPRWMVKKMEAIGDDERALRDFGVEALTRLCEDLMREGAPGFHFYTLNRWGAAHRIIQNLGLAA